MFIILAPTQWWRDYIRVRTHAYVAKRRRGCGKKKKKKERKIREKWWRLGGQKRGAPPPRWTREALSSACVRERLSRDLFLPASSPLGDVNDLQLDIASSSSTFSLPAHSTTSSWLNPARWWYTRVSVCDTFFFFFVEAIVGFLLFFFCNDTLDGKKKLGTCGRSSRVWELPKSHNVYYGVWRRLLLAIIMHTRANGNYKFYIIYSLSALFFAAIILALCRMGLLLVYSRICFVLIFIFFLLLNKCKKK